jgi:hypothetical protein
VGPRSGLLRVDINLFLLAVIEPRFLGRPVSSLAIIPTELRGSENLVTENEFQVTLIASYSYVHTRICMQLSEITLQIQCINV